MNKELSAESKRIPTGNRELRTENKRILIGIRKQENNKRTLCRE
jgi:hypothetical protein